MSVNLTPVAPGQSYVRKVAHLQVVVVKAVWGILDNTNGLYSQVNTLFVIYKSRYYSINFFVLCCAQVNKINPATQLPYLNRQEIKVCLYSMSSCVPQKRALLKQTPADI